MQGERRETLVYRLMYKYGSLCLCCLTLKVLVATIDALGHFETG